MILIFPFSCSLFATHAETFLTMLSVAASQLRGAGAAVFCPVYSIRWTDRGLRAK